MSLDTLLAHGLLPDAVVRARIRRLVRQRLREEDRGTEEAQRAHREAYVAALRKAPIAVHIDEYVFPSRPTAKWQDPKKPYRWTRASGSGPSYGQWESRTSDSKTFGIPGPPFS